MKKRSFFYNTNQGKLSQVSLLLLKIDESELITVDQLKHALNCLESVRAEIEKKLCEVSNETFLS